MYKPSNPIKSSKKFKTTLPDSIDVQSFKLLHTDTSDTTYYTKTGRPRICKMREFLQSPKLSTAAAWVVDPTEYNPGSGSSSLKEEDEEEEEEENSVMTTSVVAPPTEREYMDNIDTLIREYVFVTKPPAFELFASSSSSSPSLAEIFFSSTKLKNVIPVGTPVGTPVLHKIAAIIEYLTSTFGILIKGSTYSDTGDKVNSKFEVIYSYRQEAEYPESFDTEFNYHLAQYKSPESLPIDMLFYIDPELFKFLSTISRTSTDGKSTRFEQFMEAYSNTITNTPDLFTTIRDFTTTVYTTPVRLRDNLFIYSGVSPYAITTRELIQLLQARPARPLLIYVKSFTLDLRVAIHFAHIRSQNVGFPNADTSELLGLLRPYGVSITEPNFKVIFIQKLILETGNHINGLAFISPTGSWEAEVLKGPSNYRLAGYPFMRIINGVETIFIPVQLEPVEVDYNVEAQLEHVSKMYDEYIHPVSNLPLSKTATQESGGNSNKQTKKRNKTRKKRRSKRNKN